MVVSSLADDIVDSMHPLDTDGDGVAEDRGPLGTSGESLEPFLPEDEREKRRKSAKHVRWAINVSHDILQWPIAIPDSDPVRSMSLLTSYCWPQKVSQPSGQTPSRSSHRSSTPHSTSCARSSSGQRIGWWGGV